MSTSTAVGSKTDSNKAILLTCYMTGSTSGKNLGTPGYSYDFVAKLFTELLARRGTVIPVPNPESNLEKAAAEARSKGLEPIHVSFLPFQDVVMCKSAPNVIVPAWEFPDVPDHEFDNNPRNNWIEMANNSEMVLVGGQFTVDAMRRGGATSPINIVPVPTPDSYFQIPNWNADQRVTVPCRAYWPEKNPQIEYTLYETRKSCLKQARRSFSQTLKSLCKFLLGPETHKRLSDSAKKRRSERRGKRAAHRTEPDTLTLNHPSTSVLELSGIVYTSIFNPDDGRKNWHDLLNSFLIALGDKEDVTLVLKLITRRREAVEQLIRYYQGRNIPHRCKVAIVVDYLSAETLDELARASTFYLQTTRAEGNCLPLMNYLSAGRPGISPDHTAIGDYFDDSLGWVIKSDSEPTAWPHDSRFRIRTYWGRILWTSCRDQIRKSYDVATNHYADYRSMSRRCREKMTSWASYEAVWNKLDRALNELDTLQKKNPLERPTILNSKEHATSQAKRKAA